MLDMGLCCAARAKKNWLVECFIPNLSGLCIDAESKEREKKNTECRM